MVKYRVLGRNKFVCTSCGTIHEGPNARNLAVRCFESHAAPGLAPHIRYQERREARPDGKAAQYHRAWEKLDSIEAKSLDYLMKLWNKPVSFDRDRSPLQSLAFAYQHGNWEMVKRAAIRYGYSEAVKREIEALNIPQAIVDLLRLHQWAVDVFDDSSMADYELDKKDVNAVINRLEIDKLIEEIEGGQL